jgi:DNA polymerase III alpha subunit
LKLVSSKSVGKKHVYDIEVRDTHNFIANGIIVHNCSGPGAQRLFKKAKPSSIIDIATLTSIYRPGPLSANVDKLYINAKGGEELDWGDDRINKILAPTNTCLIFQEQVMELAEKCAGFPKEKCDEVRRAIMKRSISGGEAAKKAAQETRDGFVEGCVKNGYTNAVANNLYDKILYFAGYGFNKAHAVAYAIDSYWCAWLMTHHEEEWLSAYMESMSTTPDKRAKAFSEVKQLGYTIVPIDINLASTAWTVLPGKRLVPSFLSCKGIGKSAIEEIVENRPFASIEELLWNDDGTWRPSKFNKRSLESLIKIGAFESMDIIGEGKLFNSYHHMHEVIVENMDLIKKTNKKDPHIGRKTFFELTRALAPDIHEWSRKELAEHKIDVFGTLDVTSLIDPAVLDRLEKKGVRPIDDWDKKDIYWLCIQKYTPKKTKTGKNYLLLEVVGPTGKALRMMMWGWDGIKTFEPYATCLAEVDRNDFGFSTTSWRLKLFE